MARKPTRKAPQPAIDMPVAPVVNAERGEHELELDSATYRLRPSFSAIVAIERKCESSLIELASFASVGRLSLDRLGIIAAEFIRAGAEAGDSLTRNVKAEKIAELIYVEGVPKITAKLTIALLDAVTGGVDAEGNAKAATAN
jgi:Phage tail tube protein, GTA-gp10